MLNALEVALASPVAVALSVYPVPIKSIDRSVKLETPLSAVTASVPLRLPEEGLLPMAIVISPEYPVTTLPPASTAVTETEGVIVEVETVLPGWVENTSCVAAPTVTLKVELVAAVRDVEVAARV